MKPGRPLPLLLALAATLLGGCKQAPTTVLLRIEAATGLPYPDELRLSVFTDQGAAVSGEKLRGATLPGELVLYPKQEVGTLRLLVRAASKGSPVGEGAVSAQLQAGEQTRATLLVQPGALPDSDGDGVPDLVDNCPALANPAQGPCGGGDAGPDRLELGPVDGPSGDRPGRDGPDLDGPALDRAPADRAVERTPDLPPVCTCPLGCKPGTTTCRAMVPSNGYTATSYTALPSNLGNLTANTESCELQDSASSTVLAKGSLQGVGDTACVIALQSLTVKSGTTLRGLGSRPLVFLVEKHVTIQGTVDAGGHGTEPGPGGGKGGVGVAGGPGQPGAGPGGGEVCTCDGTGTDDCGGGGGGHGTAGGGGGLEGTCTPPSTGGKVHGQASLVPLSAGSGGASGGQGTSGMPVAPGGAGGGALQISCSMTMTLGGAIHAGGGGGGAITGGITGTSLGGGGGGAGGGVLLEAASFGGSGLVAANGGGGGGGGGSGTPSLCTVFGAPGEDAGPSLTPVAGGASTPPCGKGGGSGLDGTSAMNNAAGGGGGGGGGRIRFNWYQHTASAPVSSAAGTVSTGELSVK